MAINMGLGRLGNPNLIFKRKFRWTLQFDNICGGQSIPPSYLKSAARPNADIDETEINYLNGKRWIPGKLTWQTITVTYIDVAALDNSPLWSWLASVYNFTDLNGNTTMGSSARDYGGTGTLYMYDGCGTPLERWVYGDAWPKAINFGELDMSDPEVATIELTLRYATVQYTSLCPTFTPQACCTPCQ